MIRLVAGLFSFLSIGAFAGVLGVGALVHIYGQGLPSHQELVDYQPKMLSRVYAGDGRVIAQFARERRLFTPIEEVPPLVRNAFISAEDKNFYQHPGVDGIAIGKAITRFVLAKASGRNPQLAGASGITQQVVKNFLVGNQRALERKVKEAILAVRIDGAFSKDHILELYLNEIFFGARSYGVMAAAQNYFGKALEELTPAEAAYLAALPKKPSKLHPIRDHDDAVARRNYVLEEMAQNGHITRAAAEASKAEPLITLVGTGGPDVLAAAEPTYFTAEIRRQLISDLGQDALYEGGLTVRATIDKRLQAEAARALRAGLEKYDRGQGVYRGAHAQIEAFDPATWEEQLADMRLPRDIEGWALAAVLEVRQRSLLVGIEGASGPETAEISLGDEGWARTYLNDKQQRIQLSRATDVWTPGDVIFVAEREGRWTLRQIPAVQGAFMAMDPHNGRVLALQGGFSFQDSVFNRATQALRQPGSSFKPFVYAAALDAGYSPATVVMDAPIVVRAGGQTWKPKNSSGKFYGPTPLRRGLELSRNLMTVRIAQQIGMERIAEYAERFGVYEDMPHHLSFALGAGETTLYQMVGAYGMFANGGKRVEPTLVDRIQDRHGATLFRHDPRDCDGCELASLGGGNGGGGGPVLYDTRSQIMSPITATQLVSMLEGVVTQGTATRTVGGLGFPVAGKTGTTNDSRDAWFVGFSPNLVAGCFIGFDQPRPMGRGAYGGTLCGPVFKDFMAAAMEDREAGSFKGASNLGLVMVKIDSNTGERLPDDAEGAHVLTEFFTAGTEPPLYASFALDGDEALFGAAAVSDLPFADFDEPEAGYSEAPLQPAEGTAERALPQPPSGGDAEDIGLGTGGFY